MFKYFIFSILITATAWAQLTPIAATTSVPGDADDCAIWVHPTDPNKTVIIGNDKGTILKWMHTNTANYSNHSLSKWITLKIL